MFVIYPIIRSLSVKIDMKIIEQKIIRISLGLLAIMLVPPVLFMAIHGLMLGYGGIKDFNLLLISMGLATVLGLLGFSGGAYRLSKPLSAMSNKQIKIARLLLISGIVSGLYLGGACLYSGMPISITLLCALITIVGGLFLHATPKSI